MIQFHPVFIVKFCFGKVTCSNKITDWLLPRSPVSINILLYLLYLRTIFKSIWKYAFFYENSGLATRNTGNVFFWIKQYKCSDTTQQNLRFNFGKFQNAFVHFGL